MTTSAIIAALWVVASAITAFLSMKRQYFPGITLLMAAPLILIWLGYDYGWWVALIGAFCFVSMFRNPLMYIYRRARGENPEVPQ